MGKTARCIKIIQILSARDLVNTKELSEVLETNPRNIKEYIKYHIDDLSQKDLFQFFAIVFIIICIVSFINFH